MHPNSVKQRKGNGSDYDGNPRTALRLKQATEKNTPNTNFFQYRTNDASIEYSCYSKKEMFTCFVQRFNFFRKKLLNVNQDKNGN